jgi:hypothetical protein
MPGQAQSSWQKIQDVFIYIIYCPKKRSRKFFPLFFRFFPKISAFKLIVLAILYRLLLLFYQLHFTSYSLFPLSRILNFFRYKIMKCVND